MLRSDWLRGYVPREVLEELYPRYALDNDYHPINQLYGNPEPVEAIQQHGIALTKSSDSIIHTGKNA